jgi:hypothetical protein
VAGETYLWSHASGDLFHEYIYWHFVINTFPDMVALLITCTPKYNTNQVVCMCVCA